MPIFLMLLIALLAGDLFWWWHADRLLRPVPGSHLVGPAEMKVEEQLANNRYVGTGIQVRRDPKEELLQIVMAFPGRQSWRLLRTNSRPMALPAHAPTQSPVKPVSTRRCFTTISKTRKRFTRPFSTTI